MLSPVWASGCLLTQSGAATSAHLAEEDAVRVGAQRHTQRVVDSGNLQVVSNGGNLKRQR